MTNAQPAWPRRQFLLAAASAAAGAQALAQSSTAANNPKWPAKPIRIVVAFAPGGLTDTYARNFADFMAKRWGVPVLVDNKPGAGSIIGIDAVAKAAPDGYTLLMTTSGTVWQNRVLYTKLPYNLDTDLVPVVHFPSGPLPVGVNEKLGVRTIQEFVAYAQKNQVAMGSYAPGAYPHMVADQLNRRFGTQILTVHYRGEAPMWVDLASGQIQVAIGSYQAFSTVAARGVRAIGVTGAYRSPKLPDVPTLAEQGLSDRTVLLEGGLPMLAPAGTPEPVLRAINQAALDWAQTEQAAKLRETFAIPNKPKNLADMRREWAAEVPVWIKMAVDLGLKLD